jgi:hypothetical protein
MLTDYLIFGTKVGIGERYAWKEFSKKKLHILHVDHHADHRIFLIVFIMSETFAQYEDMPYG